MAVDVKKCLVELGQMTVPELRERYAEVFGETTGSRHKQHLIRRIVWRLQALEAGGLSERAIQRAKELACEADLRLLAPGHKHEGNGERSAIVVEAPFQVDADTRLPMPGALLRREYKGQMLLVRVLSTGFAFFGLTRGKREATR